MSKGQALLVVGHPAPGSFSHALAAAVGSCWSDAGFEVTLRDLAVDPFDPRLTAEEARGQPSRDPHVLRDQALLAGADLLAFFHPNCWGAPPAIMKGWIDRVFAPGAAYAFEKGADDGSVPVGLLRARAALVINTGNTEASRERELFGDPLDTQWRNCLLSYCGVDTIERRLIGIVATSSEEQRRGWIEEIRALAGSLAHHPC